MKKITLLLLSALVAYASETNCTNLYLNNNAPDIYNKKIAIKTQELCSDEYAVMYSAISKTPLWSAEHLRNDMFDRKAKRSDQFHEDNRIAYDDRAHLEDYVHSGYDRGHMSPSADFTNRDSNFQSFLLSNMVPQNHNNNAGVWAHIEASVRNLVKNNQEIYVVSGPLFGKNIQKINGRVFIPERLFKAVYIPGVGASAYVCNNSDGDNYKILSIAELEAESGINVFPELNSKQKYERIKLPEPVAFNSKNRDGDNFKTFNKLLKLF